MIVSWAQTDGEIQVISLSNITFPSCFFRIPHRHNISNFPQVGQGHMCLWCNKTFRTTEDVQKHMRSKGHCKMNIEGDALLEYDEW